MQVKVYQQPTTYEIPQNSPIYFDPAYSRIQDHENFILVQTEDKKFSLPGVIHQGKFNSIPGSPFGGVLSDNTASEGNKFIKSMEDSLKNIGVHSLEITLPPFFYSNYLNTELFLQNGYTERFKNFNQHIELYSESKFHYMEIRRLKKAEKKHLIFTESDEIEKIHAFLNKCRKQQGLKINIELHRFILLFEAFPDRYRAWNVHDGYKWVAALVTVNVTDEIVYYFLPGSDKNYNKWSPMVFLVDSLLDVLRNEGKKILDMGVSSVEGKKQEGLFKFKERLGAKSSPKLTLIKKI